MIIRSIITDVPSLIVPLKYKKNYMPIIIDVRLALFAHHLKILRVSNSGRDYTAQIHLVFCGLNLQCSTTIPLAPFYIAENATCKDIVSIMRL